MLSERLLFVGGLPSVLTGKDSPSWMEDAGSICLNSEVTACKDNLFFPLEGTWSRPALTTRYK